MDIIEGAKRTAFLRHLLATGEEVLVDGRPTQGIVGDEESVPELGADGEPMSGTALTVSISAHSFPPELLTHGVQLNVRGGTYGLASKTSNGQYYDLALYKR